VRMSVDEEGTIVAAAAAGMTAVAGIPPRIVFDRPFFFAIVDDETRLPLVCGLLRSPHDGAPETPDADYTDRWELLGRVAHILDG
jgi:serine protease inhibitor